MTETVQCPVCWHDETMRHRLIEPGLAWHVDPALMRWQPPPRVTGQGVSRWDHGWWTCERCEVALTPHDAGTMLDAVLRDSDPECDSIVDGMHEDARRAFAGGGR